MNKAILHHGNPKELEAKRIAEIKSLSYAERLERLMAIIEVSYALKNAPKRTSSNKSQS